MANMITDKKRESMFRAWQEWQTLQYVARECSVSRTTARRYRKLDNWDERLRRIKSKAREKIDLGYARERADLLYVICKIRDIGIDEYIAKIKRNEPLNLSISELNTLIRLELFLNGESDSRPDSISQANVNMVRIGNEDNAELETAYQKIIAELKRRGISGTRF